MTALVQGLVVSRTSAVCELYAAESGLNVAECILGWRAHKDEVSRQLLAFICSAFVVKSMGMEQIKIGEDG